MHLAPYRPRDVFASFHERSQRFACIVAHRRYGKTVASLNDEVKRAELIFADGRCAFVALPSVQAFSYILVDRAQTLAVEQEFCAIDPTDLSVTTEDYEGGIYDRFADRIETLLAPNGSIDPGPIA